MREEVHDLTNRARAVVDLLGDAAEQLGKLISNETRLAKTEMAEKLSQLMSGVIFLIGAGILMIPVLVMLLLTLAVWLGQHGLSPVMAHLAATAAGAVISVVLGLIGKSYLKPDNLRPDATIEQVSRDIDTTKELVR